LGPELVEGGCRWLLGQPAFEGLVEAFDLAAGLGVIGTGVLVGDAQADQLQLDGARAVAALGGEHGPVELSITVKSGST
jgi:hypothetical protein